MRKINIIISLIIAVLCGLLGKVTYWSDCYLTVGVTCGAVAWFLLTAYNQPQK